MKLWVHPVVRQGLVVLAWLLAGGPALADVILLDDENHKMPGAPLGAITITLDIHEGTNPGSGCTSNTQVGTPGEVTDCNLVNLGFNVEVVAGKIGLCEGAALADHSACEAGVLLSDVLLFTHLINAEGVRSDLVTLFSDPSLAGAVSVFVSETGPPTKIQVQGLGALATNVFSDTDEGSEVPEPGSLWLLAAALPGLAARKTIAARSRPA